MRAAMATDEEDPGEEEKPADKVPAPTTVRGRDPGHLGTCRGHVAYDVLNTHGTRRTIIVQSGLAWRPHRLRRASAMPLRLRRPLCRNPGWKNAMQRLNTMQILVAILNHSCEAIISASTHESVEQLLACV